MRASSNRLYHSFLWDVSHKVTIKGLLNLLDNLDLRMAKCLAEIYTVFLLNPAKKMKKKPRCTLFTSVHNVSLRANGASRRHEKCCTYSGKTRPLNTHAGFDSLIILCKQNQRRTHFNYTSYSLVSQSLPKLNMIIFQSVKSGRINKERRTYKALQQQPERSEYCTEIPN